MDYDERRPRGKALTNRLLILTAVILAMTGFGAPGLWAQELTPRAYWPAPQGTQVLMLAYQHKSGDVITDAALPIVGVDSRINSGAIAYQRTFSLLGRTSNVRFELPFAEAVTTAGLDGMMLRREVSGIGDVAATLAVNLMGAPSMNGAQFQEFRGDPQPILAAGLKVLVPTGQYDKDRLINIGSNRWAGRLQLGYIQPLPRKWAVEISVGSWFFGNNDELLGRKLRQKSIQSFDINLIHRFGPGFWASLDATYYFGGETTVDGGEEMSIQRNARLGASLAYPFARGHAVKFSYSSGVVTESGGDYDTVGLTYLFAFN